QAGWGVREGLMRSGPPVSREAARIRRPVRLFLLDPRREDAAVALSSALGLDGVTGFQRSARRVLELRRSVRLDRRRTDPEGERVGAAGSAEGARRDRPLDFDFLIARTPVIVAAVLAFDTRSENRAVALAG